MKIYRLAALAAIMFPLWACTETPVEPEDPDKGDTEVPVDPEKPVEPEKPEPAPEKPVVLWIDAEANFGRLKRKADIKHYLNLAQEAGFNSIVVDVKPVQGDVLYDSDFLPQCTSLGGSTCENRGFDYLQFFIDEARARGMRISVSTTIMTMGLPASKTGPGYTDPYWDDKFCVEYLPTGLQDIRQTDDYWSVFAFLNPIIPEVREYIMRMVEEVVTKYEFDGYVLDYCRYMNMNSDFSQASKEAFEKYIGETVENFPEDIYTFNSSDKSDYTPGKHYNKWIEWRATVIQSIVTEINQRVKKIRPEVDIEYWAGSWWPFPQTGQNWASPNVDFSTGQYWWATPDYCKTGFADQLDIFQLGAYLNRVYGRYDNESVEYAIERSKKLINGDCTIYGTIACADASFDIKEAVYLCLRETEGVMVFELSHIIRNRKWDAIKEGVDKAWKELGVIVE